jgi:glycosyltransferase involved in cell wall biosynthesis
MSDSPLFTVFTPAYNRAHTIQRVFDSLRAQSLRDFEWLVVDDGSTDHTSELIAAWIKLVDFPIRYFKQDHSGKHFAHNLALREAKGQFFMLLDSDDACVPRALEKIVYYWNTIPAKDRAQYSSVVGLCRNQHGEIIGDCFPSDPFDASLHERRYIHRLRGEKAGAARLEVLRQFPFPEIKGAQFVPEGAVWLEISKKYKARCVNEVFRIYYVDDERTGPTLSKRRALCNDAPGRLYYYGWLLNNDLKYFFRLPGPFLKAAVMLPVVAYFAGCSFKQVLKSLPNLQAKTLVLLALPISFSMLAMDWVRRMLAPKVAS